MAGILRNRTTTLAVPLALALGSMPALEPAEAADGIPIRHVIIIMQENRSFDHYFGTFPGAEGIPAGACIPLDPSQSRSRCVRPFHDPNDANAGGPHGPKSAQADLGDGIIADDMDGFVREQTTASQNCAPEAPNCHAEIRRRPA
jgi:phospholipase C